MIDVCDDGYVPDVVLHVHARAELVGVDLDGLNLNHLGGRGLKRCRQEQGEELISPLLQEQFM